MRPHSRLSNGLSNISYLLLAVTVLAAPWFFGAWERWWFWPFALVLFVSSALFGIRMLLYAGGEDTALAIPRRDDDSEGRTSPHRRLLLACVPFLLYALVRALQADVAMDAERSFLLFFTGFLVGVQVIYGLGTERRRTLFALLMADLVLLGLYGVVNHYVTGSRVVLWAPAYDQYLGRATGSYFCPDHFAGIMEFALAFGIAYALSRQTPLLQKPWYVAIVGLALAGVVLSRSRGAGITVVAVFGATIIWGFSQWPRGLAWWHRISVTAALAILLVLAWNVGGGYTERFVRYFVSGPSDTEEVALQERADAFGQRMLRTSRGRMVAGALRAWQSAPVFGIGPGMHQNRWPDFAPSNDGDREAGKRPTLINEYFHSYEVHSDWVQLLEEYGAVGFVLFLLPAGMAFFQLQRGLRRESARWQRHHGRTPRESDHALVLGGLLLMVTMGVHSLGDFNLQMPATVWMFSALLAIALAATLDPPTRRRRTSG